ncbi:hypothetical protein TNCV_2586971 [Trichonephila clavipes]|nr:hypothetical protein TNCV_2586971 [Trichonephila clavipes]
MFTRRLASESCFYTREKQEVAFDWLDDPDEREAGSGFGWAMKDNGVEPLCTQERVQQNSVGPKDVSSDYVEQDASKGKGSFIQALWTLYAKSSLYRLIYKAWKRHGPQDLTTWTLLAQAVLDGCYAEKWPDTVFQVPDVCSICLSPMHCPEKTHCGHGFHLQCLLQHLDVSNTCPLQGTEPIENILETVMSPRKMGELERSIALDQFSHFLGLLWTPRLASKAYWEAQELSRHHGQKEN